MSAAPVQAATTMTIASYCEGDFSLANGLYCSMDKLPKEMKYVVASDIAPDSIAKQQARSGKATPISQIRDATQKRAYFLNEGDAKPVDVAIIGAPYNGRDSRRGPAHNVLETRKLCSEIGSAMWNAKVPFEIFIGRYQPNAAEQYGRRSLYEPIGHFYESVEPSCNLWPGVNASLTHRMQVVKDYTHQFSAGRSMADNLIFGAGMFVTLLRRTDHPDPIEDGKSQFPTSPTGHGWKVVEGERLLHALMEAMNKMLPGAGSPGPVEVTPPCYASPGPVEATPPDPVEATLPDAGPPESAGITPAGATPPGSASPGPVEATPPEAGPPESAETTPPGAGPAGATPPGSGSPGPVGPTPPVSGSPGPASPGSTTPPGAEAAARPDVELVVALVDELIIVEEGRVTVTAALSIVERKLSV